ncbi:Putative peptidyl-prolyl cis-trans isomerase Cbf2 precursor [Candidatus Xiphinematobacter sp. Idaho Grape]|uniref:peptidylprolyl isomerase n=1 Tax=Candidatus Xiphinematobacter sp. Idaho Grape TaxID=1704307 RepID=UPI0007061AD6|nr:peptidylprolyl isomerase [Candidatus Xiphinematobacter sp. Idaho Grape]ALJ56816.1 Putative peptidyl-prolyl cis-trans isomerase Cbf2 precursor [Candidatus Xiphinematobacter sp. Idaho Grape]
MYKLTVVLLCTLAVAPIAPAWVWGSSEGFLDGVAAVVNSSVVTVSEVREAMHNRKQAALEDWNGVERQEKLQGLKNLVIRELVDRQLILQEFRKREFAIPSGVVEGQIRKIVCENFDGDRTALVRVLWSQCCTLSQLEETEMDRMAILAMRQENVKDDFVISPRQIWQYFRKNRRLYTTPERVKLRMIVLREGDSSNDLTVNRGNRRAIAEEIRAKLLSGEKFDRMARVYSEDASTKNSGGDWGWIERTTLNADLSDLAFSMRPGEISPVTSIGGAHYILFVEAHKHALVKGIEEVRDEIERYLIRQQRFKIQERWLKGLRKRAYIKILS